MAKMIDIEVLKPLIKDLIPEDNTEIIEGIMSASVDSDDDNVQSKIDEAVATAQKEAQDNYAKQLHDMFFNGVKPEQAQGTQVGEDLRGTETKNEPAPDIFVTEE